MVLNIKNRKIYMYLLLTSLIIFTNFLLYRLPSLQPISSEVVLGSIIDFLLVIPILTYFLIIRKKYSLKYLGLALLAGYGVAYFIIPSNHMQQYSFVPYVVAFSEGLLFLLELYILYKIVIQFPKLRKEYKRLSSENSFFQYNLKKTLDIHLPKNRLLYVFLSELSVFYYSLFCWRKKVNVPNGISFTYHKKTSVIAVYVMLIHATVIESIGLHYLLHHWNEIIAYILLFFNIYGVLYFIGEIQAARLTPYLLDDQKLYLQTGLSKSMEIPLENIKELKYFDGPEKFSKQELKTMYDARVVDFMVEKPMFDLLLKEEQTLSLMYGIKRKANRVVLNVDEPQKFLNEIQARLTNTEK
ncbi:hypothetical protein SM124_22785 [Bacillus sp. 31A1R]|uniref:Beta-carotene 15,15'-monooxygenase n=1 Tax=Robertmurraya mangrovi TaxID=3098077 RepID=A0ABU5J561_9BACI|nr:hypothetical protein [Bacillus sp. 31A1R]MDZ5474506.1 hypothetical protein [Bacillus sp. 31A1R]